ncbi:hypothetical protein L580_0007 [Serratia fonticola AU-P3(3)]|nr:hypothetical protein L580_0007 [Serratia fonticola AU-P3(3)]
MSIVTTNKSSDILKRYREDAELRRFIPVKPIFPVEYYVIPFGQDTFLVLGSVERHAIKSSLDIASFRYLLGLMNGTREIHQIEAEAVSRLKPYEFSYDSIAELICSLHDLGLLEEGNEQLQEMPGNISVNTRAFLGRMCAASGLYPNRQFMWQRLSATRVTLLGSDTWLHHLASYLAEAGIQLVDAKEATLSIVLYENEAELKSAYHTLTCMNNVSGGTTRERDVLFVGFINQHLLFGPITHHRRAEKFIDWLPWYINRCRPAHLTDPASGDLRAVYAASALFNIVTGIGDVTIYEAVSMITFDAGGAGVEQQFYAVSSYFGPRDWQRTDDEDRAREILLTGAAFSSGEMLPAKYTSPRVHRKHYFAQNIKLTNSPREQFYGVPIVKLPSIEQSQSVPLMPEHRLSILCYSGFGKDNDKRLTPTGGGLGSTELIVFLSDKACTSSTYAFIPGVYRYRPEHHCLERLADLPHEFGQMQHVYAHFLQVSLFQRVYKKYYSGAFKIINLDVGVASSAMRWAAEYCCVDITTVPEIDLAKLEDELPLPWGEGRYSTAILLQITDRNNSHAGTLQRRANKQRLNHNSGILFADNVWEVEEFNSFHVTRCLLERAKCSLPEAPVQTMKLASTPALNDFISLIKSRRSFRQFAECALPESLLASLLTEALRAASQHYVKIAVNHLFYWTIDNQRKQLCRYAVSTAQWIHCPLGSERIFNQELFLRAPAALIVGTNIKALASELGAAGLKVAYQCAGAALHHCGLVLEHKGYKSCIAGGVIAENFAALLPDSDNEYQPLGAICFGYPEK